MTAKEFCEKNVCVGTDVAILKRESHESKPVLVRMVNALPECRPLGELGAKEIEAAVKYIPYMRLYQIVVKE